MLRPIPNENQYRRIRAGFIAQGSSLNEWCQSNGIHRQNARDCIIGTWQGPKADELLKRLAKASRTLEK